MPETQSPTSQRASSNRITGDERRPTPPAARNSPHPPQTQDALPFGSWRASAIVPTLEWPRANTFTPHWLPARWRHVATGYILVVVSQVLVALLSRLLL